MSAPLTFLGPAIDLIGRNASVLPAIGGALEDMARPDIEEADDRFFGDKQDSENGFDTFSETPTPDWRDLYRPTPPVYREQEHVFRYFCDGSIKTYFLGTIIENDHSYPLELTQIGSAVIHRKDDGSLEVAKFERQILCGVAFKAGQKRAAKQDTKLGPGSGGGGRGVWLCLEERGGRRGRRLDGGIW